MDWILPGIIGWCATYWRPRLPIGGGGDPEEPWFRWCIRCAQIVGALSGIWFARMLMPQFPESGILGLTVIAFFGGKFGSDVIGAAVGLLGGSKNAG